MVNARKAATGLVLRAVGVMPVVCSEPGQLLLQLCVPLCDGCSVQDAHSVP